ncbi:MAG: GreA/GreB family elongation factor [Arenicella sp.]|jgi:transcription elongation factor GreB|nr:GreA/GreB family elongation factor [Arenicella sp.]HAU67354.1 transcription elongation factor GreB [Gammaproteobacteria bacterium]
MSRWRPPAPRSSAYITRDGYTALEKELKALWSKRRIVNDALSAAAAEGDRSENAEYIYRKKEQAGIDRRIRYLQKRMPDLKIIEKVGNTQQVFFGAWVTIEINDVEERYRIVGPDETDTPNKHISMDSPLAKALLKKSIDDQFDVNLGGEIKTVVILDIAY